jgi:hypothetical protein
MLYFARMLDKIRKFARGELHADFHKNLGTGLDGRCTDYVRIKYEDLKSRTLEGGTDEEILRWCYRNGRELDDNDILVWNEFIRKRGWNDEASAILAKRKEESGLSDKHEIQTMIEYFEFDEGRKT